MQQADDLNEFDQDAQLLIDQFRAAQDLFAEAIKSAPAKQDILAQAIEKFMSCETQLNRLNQKYENKLLGFKVYLKDLFIENFQHALYFTLADIHKYKLPLSKRTPEKYMALAKKINCCVYAIPVAPLYTSDLHYTLKNAIANIKSNDQNYQFLKDFMIAHIYHHGLGYFKANHMVAINLYEKAIANCIATNNAQANNTLPCLYFCLGLLYLSNVLNTSDFEKAAQNFTLAIKSCNKEHTVSGFYSLIQLYTIISAKKIKNNLSDFDILIFKEELLLFTQTQLDSPRAVNMFVEFAKMMLYDPREEAFKLGKHLIRTLAQNTNNHIAILAYANTFLHGIIPSQITAAPPKKVNVYDGIIQSLQWQSKCEETENKYTHFNIGCILFKTHELFVEYKLSKKQVISIYNSKNSKPLSHDVDDMLLRQKLLGSASYRMKLALPEESGAVNLVLASVYLVQAYLAFQENNLQDHLKYYKLHLQTRSDSLDMDVQSVTRNEAVRRQIEDLQESWSNEDNAEALAERQKQVQAIRVNINTQIIDASKSQNAEASKMVSELLETFLSSDVVNATDAINISTITSIIGKIFSKNSFDTTIYTKNAQILEKFFLLIIQRSESFGPRECHNIFCGLSRLPISLHHKTYNKCLNSLLEGLLSPKVPYTHLPTSLRMTPYLCDLFHSISRLDMPNKCVSSNLSFILECATRALKSDEPEDAINLLYPLAKLHATLLKAHQHESASQLLALLNSEIDKLATHLTLPLEFERNETVHQWCLLIHYMRKVNKIPLEKDEKLQKFQNFFTQHFRKHPISLNTSESNLQNKTSDLIIRTLKPSLKNAKFMREFVMNGLPVDLVIKLPKIVGKRPSVLIPIQIHGPGHFYHSDEPLILIAKEHLHNVVIGEPVIITYQEYEILQNQSQEAVYAFLQQKLLSHFSLPPLHQEKTSSQDIEWQLVK